MSSLMRICDIQYAMPSYFHLMVKCPICLFPARHAHKWDIRQIRGQIGHLVQKNPSFPFVELLTIRAPKDADNLDYRHLGRVRLVRAKRTFHKKKVIGDIS